MASDVEDRRPLSTLIKRECARQGLSLRELAVRTSRAADAEGSHAAPDRQSVYRWKHGKRTPNPDTTRWLAGALGLPVEEVSAVAEAQRELVREEREGRDVNRRQLLQLGMTAVGAVTVVTMQELLESEPEAMGRALPIATVDLASMEAIEHGTEELIHSYETLGHTRLLGPSLVLFHQIRMAYEANQPQVIERRLCHSAAQLALLIAMLQFDDKASARRWLTTANRTAGETGDKELQGWVLIGESFIPTYLQDHRAALEPLEHAQALVGARHGLVSAMTAALRSRAHASLGELREFQVAMDQAQHSFARAADGQAGFFTFTDAQLAFYQANSCARLGKSKDAEEAAKRALALYGASPHYMDPALVRFDLATAYVQRKELEEACRVGREALAIPVEHRTSPIISRARELRQALEPHRRERSVQEFDDFLRLALPASIHT
jgi:transcriptional regulator with XRE-family HTH domain/tetratricopeptide (TPR) repeat protein